MERKQFTFYRSFHEAIQRLRTKKDQADAYNILCEYALNGVVPDLTKVSANIATAFEFARPVLDTAARRAIKAKARMAERVAQMAMDGEFPDEDILS